MRCTKDRIYGKLYLAVAALTLAVVVTPAFSATTSYPTRPVRLVVPFAPGGGSDIVGRLIAARLSDQLGMRVVVDNRGGAGGVIGTDIVAKADPNGYTLLFAAVANTIQAAFQPNLPFDPIKAFTPVARLAGGPYTLVVHPNVAAKSVKELIALARQKPGDLNFVSSGFGATPHMSTELFKMMAGIDVRIVHFKGSGPGMIDLLGGHSHALISSIAGTLSHIKAGRVRALGVGGRTRSSVLPDVPTIAEAGLPGYEAGGWSGILAPAGTPGAILDKLNREFKTLLTLDEVKTRFLSDGLEVAYLGPSEFSAFYRGEIANWVQVIRKANLKPS